MIPTKPTSVSWTDEQWQAIYTKGQDTLISAAAGSGKTAVLIERMIEKVIQQKINVDELLVVTFTNAAAAEMRQRLAKALDEALASATDETRNHLRRQQSLVNKAQISTLHSFCLTIVKQYAYVLDIDPGFRIATEDEIALIKDDALAALLEAVYQEGDEAVFRLIDSFTSDRNDQAMEILIEKLYTMSRVHADPNAWLANIVALYDVDNVTHIDDLPFTPIIREAMLRRVEAMEALYVSFRDNSELPGGPHPYQKVLPETQALIKEARSLVEQGSWETLYQFFKQVEIANLPRITKTHQVEEALKLRGQALYKEIREQFKAIAEGYFVRSEARLLEEMRQMKPLLATLCTLTQRFGETFSALKRKRGVIDFSDLEHFALAILTERVDGVVHPSPIALDYKRQFHEVLVDEYQDVNILQETLLQLVKSGQEADGNLFMVGDIKQSIVRP